MSRSQGVGVAVVVALIGIVVAWSLAKSQSPRVSRIVLQPPSGQVSPVMSPTPKNDPAPVTGYLPADTTATEPSASPLIVPSSRPVDIVVQVAGAVRKPGVYHLRQGARNDDALKAAGGPTSDANTASVNLAARAQDGSQIYIKSLKEQPTGGASDEPIAVAATNTSSSKPVSAHLHISRSPGKTSAAGSKPAKLTNPSQGKININTATAEELQRIPGIGPSMAERLLTYRQENHGFQSIEDLMQVSGIGEKKFAKMAPFVRVH